MVLGLAVANVALIAADTRLNATFRDGRFRVHDEGPLELTYPDGRRLSVGDHFRKIRPSGSNWAGGAGFFVLVESALLSVAAVTSWQEARAALVALGPQAIPQIERDFPGQSAEAISRTAVLYTHFESGRAALEGFGFDGTAPFQSGAQFVLITPPELPSAAVAAANRRLQNELRAPASLNDLYAVVRTVASVFHDVHQQSESVSDMIEVGVTISSQRTLRLRLLSPNSVIMPAQLDHIGRLMVPL